MTDYPALKAYNKRTAHWIDSDWRSLSNAMRDEYEARLKAKDALIKALEAELTAEREKRERAERAMCDLCHTKYHKETAEQASSAGRRVVREFGEALDKLAEQGATDD